MVKESEEVAYINPEREERNRLILPRYAVRIIIFDNNGNIKDRQEKTFRIRKPAEDYAIEKKKEFERQKILATVVVVNLQTKNRRKQYVYSKMTKEMKKKLNR
jgi:hypothetical protein